MLSRDSGLKNVLSELEMRDIRNQLYKTIAKDNQSKPQEKKRYISPYQFRPPNSPLISPVQTQFRSQRDSSTNSAISRGQEFSRTPAQNTIQVSFTISCSLRNLIFGIQGMFRPPQRLFSPTVQAPMRLLSNDSNV